MGKQFFEVLHEEYTMIIPSEGLHLQWSFAFSHLKKLKTYCYFFLKGNLYNFIIIYIDNIIFINEIGV